MIQQDARNLLRRKKLSGSEVGRALLASLVHDYRQRTEEAPAPLFTQEDLGRMVSLLPSEYERRIYAEYAELYDGLLSMFREAQGLLQQVQHGLFRLLSRMERDRLLSRLLALVEPLAEHTLDPEVAALPGRVDALFAGDACDREELLAARNQLVLPAFRRLVGYNAVLSALGKGMDMPDLLVLQIPLEVVRSDAAAYDILVSENLSTLSAADAHALQEVCPPLALEAVQPDQGGIRKLADNLHEHGPGWFNPAEAWHEFVEAQEVR